MTKQAVILLKGTKFNICCDVDFLPEFIEYVLKDAEHSKEIKLIFNAIREGLKTKKYSDELFGTKAMKPFLNRENDRIICNVLKRKNQTQCIVMSEFYLSKKSDNINKELKNRYNIVSKYNYEIIE